MACHKNRRVKIVLTMSFLIEIMLILKAIKSYFKWLYGKSNLTLVVISYEIYEGLLDPLYLLACAEGSQVRA